MRSKSRGKKDPILRYRKYAIDHDLFTKAEADEIVEQAYADIDAAQVFAENSPEPSQDAIEDGVYAPW